MYTIEFEIPNKYGKILKQIFNNVELNKYKWIISNDEVHNQNGEFLFDYETYNGKNFNDLISKEDYYLVFLDLFGINNIDSSLEFELSIVDCIFCNMKIKHYDNFVKIINNLKDNNFKMR